MHGTVVVITGASAGIGAEVAEQLAREGASVALVARRLDALKDVQARCGAREAAYMPLKMRAAPA